MQYFRDFIIDICTERESLFIVAWYFWCNTVIVRIKASDSLKLQAFLITA